MGADGAVPGRLSDRLAPLFATALERAAMGERFEWDLGASGIEMANGNTVPILLLHVWIPSPILGDWISTTARINEPQRATPEHLAKVAAAAFGTLRAAHREAMHAGNGARG